MHFGSSQSRLYYKQTVYIWCMVGWCFSAPMLFGRRRPKVVVCWQPLEADIAKLNEFWWNELGNVPVTHIKRSWTYFSCQYAIELQLHRRACHKFLCLNILFAVKWDCQNIKSQLCKLSHCRQQVTLCFTPVYACLLQKLLMIILISDWVLEGCNRRQQ
jgi:hypothetical protein